MGEEKERKRKECSNIAALWLSIAAWSRSYWHTCLQGLTATEHLFAGMKESCSVARKSSGRKCCCELVGKSLPLFSKTKKKKKIPKPTFYRACSCRPAKKSRGCVCLGGGVFFLRLFFFLHSSVCSVTVCDRLQLLISPFAAFQHAASLLCDLILCVHVCSLSDRSTSPQELSLSFEHQPLLVVYAMTQGQNWMQNLKQDRLA